MAKQFFLLVPILLILAARVHAQGRDSLRYIVQMKNGDSFRGNLTGYSDSTVTIATEFGEVTVPKELVGSFVRVAGSYRDRPQHFLMPSASPNGPGGFISNYELGFFYGGFGFGNGATITLGSSLIPGAGWDSQLRHLGVKFTLHTNETRDPADFDLALGATYTWITSQYPYTHIYAVGTFPLGTGRYSAMLIYRVTGADVAPISMKFLSADTTSFTIFYQGSLGAAFGFDAPAFGRDDWSWIGEIWNNDITKPQNTVSMLGLRLTNERLSADFGVAIFTAPAVVPVTSFSVRF
jgi:hypothetical protein